MKRLLFVCQYVYPFQRYVLLIDGGSRKFEVNLRLFPPNFLGVGIKFFGSRFSVFTHTKFLCIFHGDPLRDGRVPLSRNQ